MGVSVDWIDHPWRPCLLVNGYISFQLCKDKKIEFGGRVAKIIEAYAQDQAKPYANVPLGSMHGRIVWCQRVRVQRYEKSFQQTARGEKAAKI